MGFQKCSYYNSLFFPHHGQDILLVLIYVDDIIITCSSNYSINDFLSHDMPQVFLMKDLGALHYFLGLQVVRDNTTLTLN